MLVVLLVVVVLNGGGGHEREKVMLMFHCLILVERTGRVQARFWILWHLLACLVISSWVPSSCWHEGWSNTLLSCPRLYETKF